MHGLLFCQLEQFVSETHGRGVWAAMLGRAGLPGQVFAADQAYDDADMLRLLDTAVQLLDTPAEALQETFGVYLAPQLLQLHQDLIRPGWRTLDVLLNAESLIHGAVRRRDPLAHPPQLLILQIGENRLQLNYRSSRELVATARGIIKGLGQHFGETVLITERLNADRSHQMIIEVQPAAA
jgi:hypothetical protein